VRRKGASGVKTITVHAAEGAVALRAVGLDVSEAGTVDPGALIGDLAGAHVLHTHGSNALLGMVNVPAQLKESLVSAFLFAVRAGPLCDEPLWHVGVVIDAVMDDAPPDFGAALETNGDPGGAMSEGHVVGQLADGMRKCLRAYSEGDASLLWSARLVEAVFKCSLHCLADGDQLGRLFSVVNRRRGRVVAEGMIDGTSLFHVEALIPVIEAFGIADELRKKTSGAVSSPQLVFSHWEVLDVDPLHTASTEDELEDGGETVDNDRAHNIAHRFMIQVRKRKGMPTGEKVVAVAERQRNMSRKR